MQRVRRHSGKDMWVLGEVSFILQLYALWTDLEPMGGRVGYVECFGYMKQCLGRMTPGGMFSGFSFSDIYTA